MTMRNTILLGVFIALNAQAMAQIQRASVIGSVPLGNSEFTTFVNEETGCVWKSVPHTRGVFNSGDVVQLHVMSSLNIRAEVTKDGLGDRIYATDQCVGVQPIGESNDPENPNNPYDYSGRQLKEMLVHIHSDWQNLKDSKLRFDDYYHGYLTAKGYHLSDLIHYANATSSAMTTFSTVGDYLTNSVATGNMVMVEKNLLETYITQIHHRNSRDIISFSIRFENQIVANESLSDHSKRTVLTATSIIKHLASVEEWPVGGLSNGGVEPLFVDMEVACGGNVMVGMLAGAVLGNGPGAAVGILTGMWSSYSMGCFG